MPGRRPRRHCCVCPGDARKVGRRLFAEFSPTIRDRANSAMSRLWSGRSNAVRAATSSSRGKGWTMRNLSLVSMRVLCALTCATGLSGCAPGADPLSASAASPATRGALTCRPDGALLVPQAAPDCGFDQANLKTLDPDQWARLKLEYELKCYKDAEKTARNRLRLLQAACEAKVDRQQLSASLTP